MISWFRVCSKKLVGSCVRSGERDCQYCWSEKYCRTYRWSESSNLACASRIHWSSDLAMLDSFRAAFSLANVAVTRDVFDAAGYPFRYDVGDYTYGSPAVLWWGEDAGLTIGRYCSIAGGVSIFLGGNHRTDWVTTFPFGVLDPVAAGHSGHPATDGDVCIGNDVWLADSCRIMSGVTIGDGACVASAALVTRNVPPYAIVGGVPARVIRMRFSPEHVAALLEIRWWDWAEERIQALYDRMLSSDIDGFIAAARVQLSQDQS